MEVLITYLLKSAGLISLFLLLFLLLLRKDNSFQVIRFFLIAGILLSFVLPGLEFTRTIFVEATTSMEVFHLVSSENPELTTQTGSAFDWWDLGTVIYFAGLAFLLLRLLLQLFSLFKFLRKSTHEKRNRFIYLTTDQNIKPFSFFRYIAFNPQMHQPNELSMILKHEKTHARQWHSADVLLCNLATSLLWFNPLIWLYKKQLLQNLEYIADKEAAATLSSKKEYQKVLLRTSVGEYHPLLANHFYQSLIKKRIIMLNKQTSSGNGFWKTGLILPFLVGFLFLFQVKTEAQVRTGTEESAETAHSSEGDLSITINEGASEETLNNISAFLKKRGIDITFNTVEYSPDGLITRMEVSYRKSESGQSGNFSKSDPEGIGAFTFFTKENGETGFKDTAESSLEESGGSHSDYSKLGMNPLFVINGKLYEARDLAGKAVLFSGNVEAFSPAQAKATFGAKTVDGALLITEGTIINDLDAEMKKVDAQPRAAARNYLSIGENLKRTLVTLDKQSNEKESSGNQNSSSAKADNTLSENSKNNVSGKGYKTTSFSSAGPVQQPLYVVDGEVQEKGFVADNLNAHNVESINVLKGDLAIEKYGKRGRNGVIEVSTKKGNKNTKPIDTIGHAGKGSTFKVRTIKFRGDGKDSTSTRGSTVIVNSRTANGAGFVVSDEIDSTARRKFYLTDAESIYYDQPLIVVNGEEKNANFNMESIDPKNIKSIAVLKADSAVEKYGEKAKAGVIEITLKNKEQD